MTVADRITPARAACRGVCMCADGSRPAADRQTTADITLYDGREVFYRYRPGAYALTSVSACSECGACVWEFELTPSGGSTLRICRRVQRVCAGSPPVVKWSASIGEVPGDGYHRPGIKGITCRDGRLAGTFTLIRGKQSRVEVILRPA